MATLNIKNFPAGLSRRLKERARREHRSIAQEVTHIVERALEEEVPLSILELEGLGRELWQDGDAAEHVDAERRAWD
jgi:plasmid stability protein